MKTSFYEENWSGALFHTGGEERREVKNDFVPYRVGGEEAGGLECQKD